MKSRKKPDVDLSRTITVEGARAFRTLSAIDQLKDTIYFHVFNFNPLTGTYERRRVDYNLSESDIAYLSELGMDVSRLSASEDTSVPKIDNRFIKRSESSRNVGFWEMINLALDEDDEAAHDYKQTRRALPKAFRDIEAKALGAYYIRNYVIEEGYIATKPNRITEKSNLIPLEELRQNAFDPRIRTELHANEWEYATGRASSQIEPKPIFITSDPYESIPLQGNLSAIFDRTPVIAQPSDDSDIALLQQKREEAAAKIKEANRLSEREKTLIIEALLTENASVSDTVVPWLKKLDEMGRRLNLEDLSDKHGPLGTLLYYAHCGRHSRDGQRKFAFDAAPTIVEYFKEMATPVPFSYFSDTKLDNTSLIERMRAAKETGSSNAYDAIVKHYRL